MLPNSGPLDTTKLAQSISPSGSSTKDSMSISTALPEVVDTMKMSAWQFRGMLLSGVALVRPFDVDCEVVILPEPVV